MQRRLAAIMIGDVVGYSAMMERAEEQTAERVDQAQALVTEKVSSLGGRVFNVAGDATLAEFPSAINALRCSAEIRASLAGSAPRGGEPTVMRFGLHLADVMVRGDDLVGDGVNIAARIQQEAAPDAIDVSGVFFENVRRNSPYMFQDLGERTFKNISEPIRVYRVRAEIGPHRLLQMATTREKAAQGAKRPASIAVLPFRVLGGDEDQRFLAEGLADELIVELGRFRRIFVASRSATFALAEAQPEPIKVGNALAVRHVLEGQVRKVGEQVRISLTLSETEGGSVLWSDKIVRPFSDLLNLLDQTAARIAATVCGRLEDAGMVEARRKPPENMTAFEFLLRGLDHHRLGGVLEEHSREAVKWFTKAIDADPNYGAAYAWRVCASADLPEFDFGTAEPDIRRALELDPCDPEANRIAAVFELLKNNFDQAAALSSRAIELNPTDAYIRARSAWIMIMIGDSLTALRLLDEAQALDPLLPVWCVEERGVALYNLDRFEEALTAFDRLVFQTYRSRLYRAACLVALNRLEEAGTAVREALTGRPNLAISNFLFKERYRAADARTKLRERLRAAGLPQ
jgi:TolB-like protein/class 3 adenylate cyclase/Flp pilus assembly protein TadD